METRPPNTRTVEMTVPTIDSLEELINELHNVFNNTAGSVNVDYVKALMAVYKSNPTDWQKYAIFDEFR